MTDLDDLIARLRDHKMRDNEMQNHYVRRLLLDRLDAAAALEALRDEVARLKRSFEPAPIDCIGLTLRTRKALKGSGIKTLDQLRQASDADLLSIPNLGRKGLRDIRDAIKHQ